MRMLLVSIVAWGTVLPGGPASAMTPLLPPGVAHHVAQALDALTMSMDDPGFAKDHGKPAWALDWIAKTLEAPWQLPARADALYEAAAEGDASRLWDIAATMMEVTPPGSLPDTEPFPLPLLNPPLEDPVLIAALERFVSDAAVAAALLEQALAPVPPDRRAHLAAFWLTGTFDTSDSPESRAALTAAGIPRAVQEEMETAARAFDSTERTLAWLREVEMLDRGRLLEAGRVWRNAAARLADDAAAVHTWPTTPAHAETPAGRIIIGTTGPDRYDEAALLILDPGGDDTYRDGPGAANGLAGIPLAALVDLGGDDTYRAHLLPGAGSALWGAVVVIDRDGDDRYDAAYTGAGAALFGVAWHEDRHGHDRYRAHAVAQGAGIAGFGFLIDHAGNDLYETGYYGQGFAGVMGWGILLDRSGHDRYFAGNVLLDHERNDERFLSLAQGFSIGMRPHAGGGVAALIDQEGNDVYTGDIYAQGVSYYYAAGFLLDGGGHDRYHMHQYGQGCGIHLSLGLLADAAGNDGYSGYILAQGAAHDYAVGMLFDHEGDDTYTADHHAQGRALNNAFALLIDRAGRDAYFGRQRDGTQGIGNEGGFRDYGSLALLLDLDGDDRYSGGMSNQAVTLRPLYGAVYDVATDPGTPPPEVPPPVETSGRDLDDLLYDATRYANTPERRAAKTAARAELRERMPDAFHAAMDHIHGDHTGLHVLVMEWVLDLPSTIMVPALLNYLDDPREEARRVALFFLGFHDAPEHADRVVPHLAVEATRGSALRTLGKWKHSQVIASAAESLASDNERLRIVAVNALRDLGDPQAVPLLINALDDPFFTVRHAAARALVRLGEAALDPVRALARDEHAPARRRAVRILIDAGDVIEDDEGVFRDGAYFLP